MAIFSPGARHRVLAGVAVMLLAGWTATPAAASDVPGPHRIADLGALPGGSSWASDISDGGVVVGGSTDGMVKHAVRWDQSGRMTDLGSLDGLDTYALRVNRRGTVFGVAEGCAKGRSDDCALRWSPTGVRTRLPALGVDGESYPQGMNDDGVVVGYAGGAADGHRHPVLWDAAGRVVDLGLPQGAYDAVAHGINNQGIVVGWASFDDGTIHGLLWDRTGRMTELPRSGDQVNSWAAGITDDGLIIGNIVRNPDGYHLARWRYRDNAISAPQLVEQPAYTTGMSRTGIGIAAAANSLRWDRSGRVTELRPFPGDEASEPAEVNDAGIVVGYSTTTNTPLRAVWWDRTGTPREFPSSAPGAAVSVSSLNDAGVMVGSAQFATGSHAAMWR